VDPVVTLSTVGDYVVLILVAAGGGAIGGLAATAVPTASPGVNKPRFLTGPLVGAVAAVALLLIFPGTKEATTILNGHAVTTTTWSLIRVIPVSLIAGWAGPKALAILQDRLLAAAKDATLEATVNVAKVEAEKLADATQQAELESAKKTIDAAAS
jgi:hypothetical protein